MADERTKNLIKMMSSNPDADLEDFIEWDWDNIRNLKLIEFDAYRLFYAFAEFYGNNGEDGIKGKLNNHLSKWQIELLKSKQSKIFKLGEPVKHLLFLTKPSKIKQELKMPFNSLFVDFDYCDKKNEFRIFGLMINFFEESIQREIFETAEKNLQKNFIPKDRIVDTAIITTLLYSKEKGVFIFIDINLNLKTGKIMPKIKFIGENTKEGKIINSWDKYQVEVEKLLCPLVVNLLLFLNEPRVTIYIQDRNHQAREKKGLIPIPSELRTKIEIGLSNYVEKIYFTGLSHSKLGFSFWVRGHWRRFLSPRYINKQGQKTWILPHICGEGLMPPQIFEIINTNHDIKEEVLTHKP